MTELAEVAPTSFGTVADEIMSQAIEQNAARGVTTEPAAETKSKPAREPVAGYVDGYVDPLDEAMFTDEALANPAKLQEARELLRKEMATAKDMRQKAHNARAKAERRESKFKGKKGDTLAKEAALRAQEARLQADIADMQQGDPNRFIQAIGRLSNNPDPAKWWRENVATALAKGEPFKAKAAEIPKEIQDQLDAIKAERESEKQAAAQYQNAQAEAQIQQLRIEQVNTARTFDDLPQVAHLAHERPAVVDARLSAIRMEHYQQHGTAIDIRGACALLEGEIRSHYELLQRAGNPSGAMNGGRGAAGQAPGQAGKPEQIAKPASAQSSPSRQQYLNTLPSSLTSEPAANKRGLTSSEKQAADIEAFERLGIFGNFGM